MTRKDYVLLAHALHASKPRPQESDYLSASLQWGADVQSIARALQGENPRFDAERFVTACETGSK